MWPITLSGRLPIVALVGRYLTNQLIGRELTPNRIPPFTPSRCRKVVLCGISRCFHLLSPCLGQIAHALLTRPPLEYYLPSRRTSNSIPARLACVKHAASVRPEPGSNSDVQSSSSTPSSAQTRQSPRLLLRQGVSLIRNLTVLSLSSFSLCIVFKNHTRSLGILFPRSRRLVYYSKTPILCQPLFSLFSEI